MLLLRYHSTIEHIYFVSGLLNCHDLGVKGIALQELGELEEAAACYEKAIALSPDYVLAHYNLAYVRQDQVCSR